MKSKAIVSAEGLKPAKASVSDVVAALRGCYKGPGSLSRDRERDHKRDERIKDRKFGKLMERLSQRQRNPDCLF
jgi:iron only hydrogenase large subunit-like protein